MLANGDYIPVIAPVAADGLTTTSMPTLSRVSWQVLQAEKLMLLTNVTGLWMVTALPDSAQRVDELITDKVITAVCSRSCDAPWTP